MKNLFTKFIITLALTISINEVKCQQVREIIEAIKPEKAYEGIPVLQKKSHVIQVGYGFVNNVASLINISNLFGGLGGLVNAKANSKVGPIYLNYEYFIKDNIGLGLGVSYAKSRNTYSSPFLSSQSANIDLAGTSILLSSIYHFYTTNKLDPYTKVSIGATIWKNKSTLSDGTPIDIGFTPPTPIAYQALLGLRYFVSPKIAPVGELSYSNLKFSASLGMALKL
jgi:hypothetical protein